MPTSMSMFRILDTSLIKKIRNNKKVRAHLLELISESSAEITTKRMPVLKADLNPLGDNASVQKITCLADAGNITIKKNYSDLFSKNITNKRNPMTGEREVSFKEPLAILLEKDNRFVYVAYPKQQRFTQEVAAPFAYNNKTQEKPFYQNLMAIAYNFFITPKKSPLEIEIFCMPLSAYNIMAVKPLTPNFH